MNPCSQQPPVRRRDLAAGLVAGLTLTALPGCGTTSNQNDNIATGTERNTVSSTSTNNILLAYFSRAGENYWNGGRRTLTIGNTQSLAQLIQPQFGCDMYRIVEADPYPDSYDQTVDRNVAEERADARPEIAGALPDLTRYNTVLLGCPVWNVRAPMILSTFLESVDLTGKTIWPFVTYAVSGLGTVEEDYRAALPGSTIRTGLAIRGEAVDQAGPQVRTWLDNAGLLP